MQKGFTLKDLKTKPTWILISALLVLLLSIISCIGNANRVVDVHGFSNLVLENESLWFGAGYKLYRVDLDQQSATLVYDSKNVLISFVQSDGERLYFGGDPYPNGRKSVVWSLDLESGNIIWEHEFDHNLAGGLIATPPLVGKDIFIIGFRRNLYALDKFSGEEKWKVENHWFGTGELLTPILVDEQLIYGPWEIGKNGPQSDHTIAFADLSSGKTLRTIFIPGRLGAIPAIHGNCLFVKDEIDAPRDDLQLNCVNLDSSEIVWSTGGDGYGESSYLEFYNGWVFDVFSDQLFAMDEQTGTIYWKSPNLDETIRNPQVIEGMNSIALEALDSRQVIFLDLETGVPKDEKLSDVLSSPIFIGQEAVYGTTNAIVRVDINTESVVWSIPVDSQYQDILSED
jgi:outer membrane protein assembly factor BamB